MWNKRSLVKSVAGAVLALVSLPAWCKGILGSKVDLHETALLMIYTHPDGGEYWLEHNVPDEGKFPLEERLEAGKQLLIMKARFLFVKRGLEEGSIKAVEKGPDAKLFIWNSSTTDGIDKFDGVYIKQEDENRFDLTSVKLYMTRNSRETRNYDLIPGPGWTKV